MYVNSIFMYALHDESLNICIYQNNKNIQREIYIPYHIQALVLLSHIIPMFFHFYSFLFSICTGNATFQVAFDDGS